MPSPPHDPRPADRAPGWRTCLLGGALVWLPEVFLPWDWRPGAPTWRVLIDFACFIACYAVMGRVFLATSAWMDGPLRARWPGRPAPRIAAGALGVLAAVEATYVLLELVALRLLDDFRMPSDGSVRWALHAGVIALVLHGWRVVEAEARERASAARRIEGEADAMHAALAGAELSLLERQVEPHFLFNTLAHVRRSLRQAPDEAQRMLAALDDYLSRAGPSVRREDWTIGDELALVETWLGLVRHRFGQRLRVAIDAPDALRGARLPALSIATLVENAVQHGLSPKSEGGEIRIGVRPEDGAGLCITVADDGVGLRGTQGGGLGLATVRARLRAAFGAQAALVLEGGASGVCAAIRIPAHA